MVHAAWRALAIAWQETWESDTLEEFSRTDSDTAVLSKEKFMEAIAALEKRDLTPDRGEERAFVSEWQGQDDYDFIQNQMRDYYD
jgi:hypothetical protein